jgi:hypothetical protein
MAHFEKGRFQTILLCCINGGNARHLSPSLPLIFRLAQIFAFALTYPIIVVGCHYLSKSIVGGGSVNVVVIVLFADQLDCVGTAFPKDARCKQEGYRIEC